MASGDLFSRSDDPFQLNGIDSFSQNKSYSAKFRILDSLLLTLLFFLFFYGLDSYGLMNNNEGLYAQISREMLENKHYIIPTLLNLPYIEKPPLLYWLIALSFKIFGLSEFSARFITALAGFSLSLILGVFSRWTSGSATISRLSVFIFSTCGGVIVFSRTVFFDVLLTAFLSAAFYSFYHWHQTLSRWSLKTFYICAAAAVMTKGFLACVLLALVILIFLQQTGTFRSHFVALLNSGGVALFLLLVMPWHIAANLQEDGFAWFYFINEHVLRFLGRRLPKDYYEGSFYYYLPRLLLIMAPWSLHLGLVFKKSPAEDHQYSLPSSSLKVFLKTWIIVFMIFFSLSKAKANYYLVTILPPLAYLLALKIYALKMSSRVLLYRHCLTLFWMMVLPFSAVIVSIWQPYLAPWQFIPSLTALGLWMAMNTVLAYGLFWPSLRWPYKSEIALGLQMMPLLLLSLQTVGLNEGLISARPLQSTLATLNNPVVFFRDFETISAVGFYLPTAVSPVFLHLFSPDLEYGLRQSPALKRALSEQRFKDLSQHQDVTIFLHQKHRTAFEQLFPQALLKAQAGLVLLYKIESRDCF